MNRQTSRQTGFTLVEIMIVVAIIGLLAAIAIPNFIKARARAQQGACINNLRVIDGAKEQWALENKKTDGAACASTDLTPYLKRNIFPTEPAGGSYRVNPVGTLPDCSLSAEGHTL